jgi:hypothetical protein
MEASRIAAERARYDSQNRRGENAASLGTSSTTARRTTRSRLSCRLRIVSATSLYRLSMNSPVCRSISPNASKDPCAYSTLEYDCEPECDELETALATSPGEEVDAPFLPDLPPERSEPLLPLGDFCAPPSRSSAPPRLRLSVSPLRVSS